MRIPAQLNVNISNAREENITSSVDYLLRRLKVPFEFVVLRDQEFAKSAMWKKSFDLIQFGGKLIISV